MLIDGVVPSALTSLHLLVRFVDGSEHLVQVRINRIQSLAGTFEVQVLGVQGELVFPSWLIEGEEPVVTSDFVLTVFPVGTTTSSDRFACRCDIVGEDPIPLVVESVERRRNFRFSQIPTSEYGTIDLLFDSAVVWRFNVLFNV